MFRVYSVHKDIQGNKTPRIFKRRCDILNHLNWDKGYKPKIVTYKLVPEQVQTYEEFKNKVQYTFLIGSNYPLCVKAQSENEAIEKYKIIMTSRGLKDLGNVDTAIRIEYVE